MYKIETVNYHLYITYFCAQRQHVDDTSWTSRTLGLLYVRCVPVWNCLPCKAVEVETTAAFQMVSLPIIRTP